jgi:hypothetical protein
LRKDWPSANRAGQPATLQVACQHFSLSAFVPRSRNRWFLDVLPDQPFPEAL